MDVLLRSLSVGESKIYTKKYICLHWDFFIFIQIHYKNS